MEKDSQRFNIEKNIGGNNMTTLLNSMDEWKYKINVLVEKSKLIKDQPYNELFKIIGNDIEVVLYPIANKIVSFKTNNIYSNNAQYARIISNVDWSAKEGLYGSKLVKFLLINGRRLLEVIPESNPKREVLKEVLKVLKPLEESFKNNHDYTYRYEKKVVLSFKKYSIYAPTPDLFNAVSLKWTGHNNVTAVNEKNSMANFCISPDLQNVYVLQQIYFEVKTFLNDCIVDQEKIFRKANVIKDSFRKEFAGILVARKI